MSAKLVLPIALVAGAAAASPALASPYCSCRPRHAVYHHVVRRRVVHHMAYARRRHHPHYWVSYADYGAPYYYYGWAPAYYGYGPYYAYRPYYRPYYYAPAYAGPAISIGLGF